jgi:uncharacterized membrane protein
MSVKVVQSNASRTFYKYFKFFCVSELQFRNESVYNLADQYCEGYMKRIRLNIHLLLLAFLIALGSLVGFDNDAFAEGDWVKVNGIDCSVWSYSPVDNQTVSWSGACDGSVGHGRGFLQWFINGKPKLKMEVTLKNGKYSGFYVATDATGYRFEGTLDAKTEKKSGSTTYPDGSTYTGPYNKGGKFQGRGTRVYPDGSKYVGQWRNGLKHGKGKYNFKSGSSYDGDWRDDNRNGYGVNRYNTGHRYEGQYKNGKRNGSGTLYFKEGGSLSGTWKNSEANGQMRRVRKNGTRVTETWKNGKRVQFAKIRLCNKTSRKISVAKATYAGRNNSAGKQLFKSEGWWTVQPAKCFTLISGPFTKSFVYYYASGNNAKWGGKYHFCTLKKKFTIVDTQCQSGFKREGFEKIDLRIRKNGHTINLNP